MKDREDNLIKMINDFIESERSKPAIDKNKNEHHKQYILCREIEVTHRYFYINVDKSNNEILCLLDGCRSEDDMRNILRENEISIIEVEDAPSVYENEFRVCDVADDVADCE